MSFYIADTSDDDGKRFVSQYKLAENEAALVFLNSQGTKLEILEGIPDQISLHSRIASLLKKQMQVESQRLQKQQAFLTKIASKLK